jgi:hypothetical protein
LAWVVAAGGHRLLLQRNRGTEEEGARNRLVQLREPRPCTVAPLGRSIVLVPPKARIAGSAAADLLQG